MSELQLFHCPSCGAPLAFAENATLIQCTYCKNSVVVPATLQKPEFRDAHPVGLSIENQGDIYLLIANNKKLEAIKLLRDQTGLSLKDASAAVDIMENTLVNGEIPVSTIEATLQSRSFDQNELLDLLSQGRKIDAIRLVREATDLSLKEAKEAIEALEAGDRLALVHALAGRRSAGMAVYAGLPQAQAGMNPPQVRQDTRMANAFGISAGCGLLLLISATLLIIAIPIFLALSANGGPLAPLMSKLNPLAFASIDFSLKGEGIAPGQFNDPRAIAVDGQGNLFVADYSTGRLQSFDPQGEFRWLVNLGDEVIVESMAAGSDEILYLAAQGTLRRFNTLDGTELPAFPDPQREYYFEDVSVAPDGRVALISRGEDLLVLDTHLQPLFEVQSAVSAVTGDAELDADVAIDSLGNAYILGTFNSLVLKYSPEGKYTNQFGGDTVDPVDGKFRAVGDLAVDLEGRVYVSDIFGVQVFDGDGRYLDQFKLVQYAHGLAFDRENHLFIASNEPQVVRLSLRK